MLRNVYTHMDKKLTVTLSIIGSFVAVSGVVFGEYSIMDLIYPPEPEAIGMLDNTIDGWNHVDDPKKISFSLHHNGTNTWYIHDITFKTKRMVSADCIEPSDDPHTFAKQEMYVNPPLTSFFEPVEIQVTPKDNFTSVNVGIQPYQYSNGEILEFDYYLVDELGDEIEESIGLGYWDYTIKYSDDGKEENTKSAKYHPHTVKNPRFC